MKAVSLIGLGLIALGVFILFGGVSASLSWVLGYWDKEYVETYRGYDIYYFPNPNAYGFQLPDGTWKYYRDVESAERAIDDMLDSPIYVGAYNGWDIYQTPGTGFYYAVNPYTNETVGIYSDLESLKAWLDEVGPPQPGESLEAEVEGHVYTSPGEVEVESPERRLGWLRWLGLPVMALGAVLALGREER